MDEIFLKFVYKYRTRNPTINLILKILKCDYMWHVGICSY